METPKDRRRLLYVVRHAKSSWKDEALDDLDRPLSPRGRRAVGLLSARFRRSGLSPALVLCSPARRTLETYEGIRAGFADDADMWTDEALYGADVGDLLDVIRSVPEAVPSLMVIGHNPGLQDLVLRLASAGSDQGSIARCGRSFPPVPSRPSPTRDPGSTSPAATPSSSPTWCRGSSSRSPD